MKQSRESKRNTLLGADELSPRGLVASRAAAGNKNPLTDGEGIPR